MPLITTCSLFSTPRNFKLTTMMKSITCLTASFVLFFSLNTVAGNPNPIDTRMMTQPAISADHIAFIYAEDLWVANTDGSQPRRLTENEGIETNPVFSPDGKWIAF